MVIKHKLNFILLYKYTGKSQTLAMTAVTHDPGVGGSKQPPCRLSWAQQPAAVAQILPELDSKWIKMFGREDSLGF